MQFAFSGAAAAFHGYGKHLTSVRLALVGSLVLSLIAVLGVVTVGKDGALYLDIAQRIGQAGMVEAWKGFDWPWYPLLLAGTHGVTGLSYEGAAYLWNTVFIAGTCALVVDSVRRLAPGADWWACLVVLSMPAINQFRSDIIREFGFWFFCSLAVWLALRCREDARWSRMLGACVAVVLAAMFRLEAVVVLPALLLCTLPELLRARWRPGLALAVALVLTVALVALGVILARDAVNSQRVSYFMELIDPRMVFGSFNQLASQFANSLVNPYSADEAGRIIFFGFTASLLIKLVHLMGPVALVWLSPASWSAWKDYLRRFTPAAWVALCYLSVLMIFYIRAQFMNGRYLSFLDLVLVPLLALACWRFSMRHARLGKVVAVLALLVMLGNVISLGAPKTHYLEAAKWVAANTDPHASVFYEDGRIAYYAGRGYVQSGLTREQAMADGVAERYTYLVVETGKHDPWLDAWLAAHPYKVLARFENKRKDTVLVLGR